MTALAEAPVQDPEWDSVKDVFETGPEAAALDSEVRDNMVDHIRHQAGKVALLSAEQEVDLAKKIEAGLFAEKILAFRHPDPAVREAAKAHILARKLKAGGGDPNPIPEETVEHLIAWAESTHLVTDRELRRLVREGVSAKERFVWANLRFVLKRSVSRQDKGMDREDLILEGSGKDGLIRAVEKFDYFLGYKFSTYVDRWVRQAMDRAIDRKGKTMRTPPAEVRAYNRVRRAKIDFMNDHGSAPTPAQLAAKLGVTEAEVVGLLRYDSDAVSLDASLESGEETVGNITRDDSPNTEETALALLEVQELEGWLSRLDELSARVVRLRFGLVDGTQYPLFGVARMLNRELPDITADDVEQIEKVALQHLRQMARAAGAGAWGIL